MIHQCILIPYYRTAVQYYAVCSVMIRFDIDDDTVAKIRHHGEQNSSVKGSASIGKIKIDHLTGTRADFKRAEGLAGGV